jgi:serine/threonine protein kinase
VSDESRKSLESVPLLLAREIDRACDKFSEALKLGQNPRIEEFLGRVPESGQSPLLCELIVTELEAQLDQGRQADAEAYYARFPDDRPAVDAAFGRLKVMADAPREEDTPRQQPAADRALASSASHNLLFGIIALQNDFIPREALVAGFDAWVHDKSRTLAEILVGHEALSAEDRDFLDRLVAKFLQNHGGDPDKSLAALSSVPQVRPELEQLGDADLSVSLGHVGDAGPGDPRFASTIPFTEESPRGRFRILRPHAKGGLGQVSVALDQDLNREVALKEIQPKHADNVTARERFLLEAEITGALEHPGIVPVYALGQGPDGRPFYAMRFVKGDSLKQAIEDFHKPDNPIRQNPGARQLALRQLLGRFIDVCNAMEYAHSRGVLHRDLKPGNIMVGKYGETLVVDWGLAKSVGKKEIVSDEATLRPSSALSSSGQTVAGQPIGTPAYMSPEQAAGKLDELCPASDVYSLGATLYHLLCGKAPFEGKDYVDIAREVQRGEFVRPRLVIPEIPQPLEAICLKAMALQPSDRYQTARALADDLEHWMADEPVVAAPETLGARLSRLGDLLSKTDRRKEAETAFIDALAIEMELAADIPNQPDYQNQVAGTLASLGTLCFLRRDFRGAKTRLEEAFPHHQAALQANPQNPTYRQFFRNNLLVLVPACAGLQDQVAALQAAKKLRDLGWDPPANAYDAACAMALCVPIAREQQKLDAAERESAIKFFADEAMKMLHTAVTKGYKNRKQMMEDANLAALRGREDFQKLVDDLDK